MSGARTGLPLLGGIVAGVFIAFLFLPPEPQPLLNCKDSASDESIFSSKDWVVRQEKLSSNAGADTKQYAQVVRARFAATELGMRERVAVVMWAESGALAMAVNASLASHVDRVVTMADSSRVDAELASLPSLISFRSSTLPPHLHIVNAIFNNSMHENYDWVLIIRDSTYVNPFQLDALINKMSWNERVVMGIPHSSTASRCSLSAGMLLSNAALQLLVQQRQMCSSLVVSKEEEGVESCVHTATNLTCTSTHQGQHFTHWPIPSGETAHDSIAPWSTSSMFNSSLSVSSMLSEADARALHDHFIHVQLEALRAEASELEKSVEEMREDSPEGPAWPIGSLPFNKPPNRYQVGVWEFFTSKDIFVNEANENVRALEGEDKKDVEEVVAEARRLIESEDTSQLLTFVQLTGGYRLFDAQRGMDYMVDLVFSDSSTGENVERRVHLTRLIQSTTLMNNVPYVKEDSDLTIVVPVAKESDVLPARRLLARQARLCVGVAEESRHTRVVVVTSSSVDSRSNTFISNDLEELKRRCARSALEASVLVSGADAATHTRPFSAIALDEAVDHFGPHTMYLLLSPHADIQKELLDRARINTIKHLQVFMPIPFVEFHPTLSGMDVAEGNGEESREAVLTRLRDATPPLRKRQLIVQKDHGRFDPLDYSVVCVYGTDYVRVRDKMESSKTLDVASAFLSLDNIHLLRAVEPALRLRYHERECEEDLNEEDLMRCTQSRRDNMAAKDQLSRLLFKPEL